MNNLPPPNQSQTVPKETLQKIKLFLDQETKKLSPQFPYCLDLYKNGKIDENKAGMRISETAQQFDNLGLCGLLFYYKLHDHSMRVPHWHANAIEVGVVLTGKMKITIWDGLEKPKVFTVEKNGTWLIPQAALHALENVGDSELDFLVVYNSPIAADRDFVTAWAALPDTLLERSLGLLPNEILTLKKTTQNRLSSYDAESIPEEKIIPSPFAGNFYANKALFESDLGTIRRIDVETNPVMESMALQQTMLNPGTIREPHWYTAGDAVLFVNKGTAFFTMMDHEGTVYNALINPGDLIYIPVGTFHTYVNVGTEILEIYEAFNASKGLSEVTLLSGAKHFSAGTLAGATGLNKDVAEKILKKPIQNYMTSL
jgi:oxalate decarboxylase/phosphoglucose isomerase-like protein (cupin superfamily)